MKKTIQRILKPENFDPLVAAVAGWFILFIYTRHSGIGISPDSVVYLSTARNIADHGQFHDFNDKPMVIFPLLYPVFLGLLALLVRYDPLQYATVLNPLLFGLFIFISGKMMRRFIVHSRWVVQMILSCLVLSPCLLEIYSMLWSETIFLLLLLLFIFFLNKYLKTLSVKNLVILSCLAGLACVTRYAGITLIATGGLMIILNDRIAYRKRMAHLALFSVLSVLLLLSNFLHNHIHSETLTGIRERSVTPILENVGNFGYVLCDWLPLPTNNYLVAFLTALSLILIFAIVFTRRYLSGTHFDSYENIATAFFVIYGAFMILSATISRYEVFSSRLVSPAYIPMLWGGSSMIMLYREHVSSKKRLWFTVIVLVVFACFQINQWKDDFENHDGIKDAGIPGYTEDPWNRDSEIVNFLRLNRGHFQPGYALYSNADDAVYFFLDLHCNNLPHKLSNPEKTAFYATQRCYVIWFDDGINDELIGLDDVKLHRNMNILYQFSNGAIYISR